MSDLEPRGHLERVTLEKLRERGWEVIESRRDGLDLDLTVAYSGTRGLVRFRNAFEVPKGTVGQAETSPTLLRIDLGEPSGEPERWAVWDRYRFPTSKDTPRYYALVFHEAIGAGWASVAACSVAPKQPWWLPHEAIDIALARLEALAPQHTEESRRANMFGAHRNHWSVQRQRGKDIATAVILGLIGLGGAAVVANVMPQEGPLFGKVAVFVVFGVPALVMLPIATVLIVRLCKKPGPPLEDMAALAEMVRATGAFTTVETTPRKVRDGLPMVVRCDGCLVDVAAPLSVSRLSASSTSHGVSVEAEACRIAWPEGLLPESRLVPDRWLTVDLTGDEAALAQLPEGPRQDRHGSVLRWTFTGEEVDQGAAADLFQAVATALGTTASPYR